MRRRDLVFDQFSRSHGKPRPSAWGTWIWKSSAGETSMFTGKLSDSVASLPKRAGVVWTLLP